MKLLGLPRLALCSAPAALTLLAAAARAEEPRKVTEPYVMAESASMVSVADAFDEGDVFDLHLSLGYQQQWKSGSILRESHNTTPPFSSGGYTAGNMAVAKYSESTGRLNTRADIGLYKDIALVFRLPIILSHDRKLEDLDGSADRASVVAMGAPGEQLFTIPFESPTRSGIEYLAVGLDFGIFNQTRDETKPTWVLGFEGRFNVSEPMHSCRKDLGGALNLNNRQVDCADPSDINRDGTSANDGFEGELFSGSRDAGVSRGTTGLQIHTYLSRRVKYVEPYGGFSALFEFQNDDSDYGATSLEGSLVNHPPFRGTMVGGLSVYPWEVRERYQRIEVDFRAEGTYVSEGRDYSPLFDALGSSDAPSLRRPNYAQFNANTDPTTVNDAPSVVNPQSQKVYVSGITDVQQHGVYRFSSQVTFQAGEYVKFNAGGAFTIEQGRVITFDQPCNPEFDGDESEAGPCRSRSSTGSGGNVFNATGIPNPNYRPSINVPGRRFRYDDVSGFDVWLNATVMF